ncbi:MAG: hypothetical protein ACFFBD_30490, partial [Candidatus Hodarchaeota archaeon]
EGYILNYEFMFLRILFKSLYDYLHNVVRTFLTIYRAILAEKPNKIIYFAEKKSQYSQATGTIVAHLAREFNILAECFQILGKVISIDPVADIVASYLARMLNTSTEYLQNPVRRAMKIFKRIIDFYFKFHNALFLNKKTEAFLFMGAKMLGDVVDRLCQEGRNCLFFPYPPFRKHLRYILRVSGIESPYFRSFISEEDQKRISTLMRRKWDKLSSVMTFKKFFNQSFCELKEFNEFSLWDLLRTVFKTYFIKTFPRLFEESYQYYRLFKTRNIRAIVMDEEWRTSSKLSILRARQFNIRIIHLHHGIYGKYAQTLMNDIVDVQCVWGRQIKDEMIEAGLPSKKLKVIGNPTFDTFFRSQHKNQKLEVEKKSKKSILFVNSWYNRNSVTIYSGKSLPGFFETLEALVKILKKFPDFTLVLKLHPNDSICDQEYIDLLNKFGATNYSITRSSDNFSIIRNSDLVLTFGFSSVSVEGLIVGKPVINLYISITPEREFSQSLNICSVFSIESLNVQISKAVTEKQMSPNPKDLDYVIKMDPFSSIRLHKLLTKGT